ncbi:MAG: hypothetical protein ACR2QB_04890 [Gammaproteobacteria bacterium]
MSIEKGSFWSAIVWMLNGILLVTWLYGASLAYQKDGMGQGLLALFVPPYGIYVAYSEGVAGNMTNEGAGSWVKPGFSDLVTEFENRCLTNDADRELSGMVPAHYAEFCLCIARATVDLRMPEEIEYQKRTGNVTDQFQQRFNFAQRSCAATARFVRIPPDSEPTSTPAAD